MTSPQLPTLRNIQDLHKALDRDHRPWGSYYVISDGPIYKSKVIIVSPGERLSLQRHEKRDELWLILSGTGELILDNNCSLVYPRDQVEIPRRTWHRIKNVSMSEELVIFEVQVGTCNEEDIERKDDDYGRT